MSKMENAFKSSSVVDPNDCHQDNGTDKLKKKKRVRQKQSKAKNVPEHQSSPLHNLDTHPSPRQQSQATQTGEDLQGATTSTTGTQTLLQRAFDKSTQTPGPRLVREPLYRHQPQELPLAAVTAAAVSSLPLVYYTPDETPQDPVPSDQSSPSLSTGTSEQSSEDQVPPRPELKRDLNHLFVLTWNIDGLDQFDSMERVQGLLCYLAKIKADVVLLQELTPPIAEVLQEVNRDYECIFGNTSGYFTGILLLKSRVRLLQSHVVNYPTTEQGRNLLMAQLSFSGHRLWALTSHLESCRDASQERMNQLRRVWKRIREAPLDEVVIFGGDTNLRDKEVKRLGGLPEGIVDVWEDIGQPEECQYTWDTVTNNNRDVDFQARLRFDRLYVRSAAEGMQITPLAMRLVGKKKLKCGRFISDHWGIHCRFSLGS